MNIYISFSFDNSHENIEEKDRLSAYHFLWPSKYIRRYMRQRRHVSVWMKPRKIKINILLTCVNRLWVTKTNSQCYRRHLSLSYLFISLSLTPLVFFLLLVVLLINQKKLVTSVLWTTTTCDFSFVNCMSIIKKCKNVKWWQHHNHSDNKSLLLCIFKFVLLHYLFVSFFLSSIVYALSLISFCRFKPLRLLLLSFSFEVCYAKMKKCRRKKNSTEKKKKNKNIRECIYTSIKHIHSHA